MLSQTPGFKLAVKNGYLAPESNYFLEKYDELSESVAFAPKMRYFKDQNGPKAGPH